MDSTNTFLGMTITLHLIEGQANGIIKAKLDNWSGIVTYAPRTKLDVLASDKETKRPGVYVLAKLDPESDSAVYIGQADNVFDRLKEHERDASKAYLDTFVAITSTDESLSTGPIIYLESRLIEIAHKTRRAKVANRTRQQQPTLSASERDKAERFLINLRMILPAIGLKFALPPLIHTEPKADGSPQSDESPIFVYSPRKQGTQLKASATAQLIGSEFVVLKGSTALDGNNSATYKDQKQHLIDDKYLVLEDGVYKFVVNVPFKSPSAAAAVVSGQEKNGRICWMVSDEPKKSYGEWFDARLNAQE